MARSLTSGMQAAITAQRMRPFFLIEAHFDSGDLLLWTGYGTLEYNSKSYTGTGEILELSPIRESKQMEAAGLTFTLSGLDAAINAIALNEEYQDRVAELYLGAFDDDWNVVVEPYLQFEGRIDTMPLEDDDGIATVQVTVENILTDMNSAAIFNYTPEDQALYFSGDSGFDRVAGLQEKDIKLGAG